MKLLDHFSHSGGAVFRLRSYLPLLLLPAFVLAARSGAAVGAGWKMGCEIAGLAVAMSGLALRVLTIGSAPPGTSGRGTRDPYASLLNTRGVYSVVRHPLYVANTLVGFGLALFTATWYLPVIVLLAGLLYHERICVREEVFLEQRFGEVFRAWADEVPALVPALGRYRAAAGPFCWKRVLGREFHALFVIGAGALFLDALTAFFANGRFTPRPIWAIVCAVTGLLFLILTGLKKWTSLLRVPESAERSAGA